MSKTWDKHRMFKTGIQTCYLTANADTAMRRMETFRSIECDLKTRW